MAKFVGGLPPFIGTRDNLTIYFMKGEYIVRTKSSLTRKRVKHDPAFARTMENAGRLKKASRIASRIYRQMPAGSRVYRQYRELVGKAMGLLKNGFDGDYVLIALEAVYLDDLSNHLSDCLPDPLADHLPRETTEIAVLPAQDKSHVKKMGTKLETITLFTCFTKEYPSNRRRCISSERFQVGSAGLRLFEIRLMSPHLYSKPKRLITFNRNPDKEAPTAILPETAA
jgi:hypothetical protein